MADIRDLKSRGEKSPCGFDSRLGHPFLPLKRGLLTDKFLLDSGRTTVIVPDPTQRLAAIGGLLTVEYAMEFVPHIAALGAGHYLLTPSLKKVGDRLAKYTEKVLDSRESMSNVTRASVQTYSRYSPS